MLCTGTLWVEHGATRYKILVHILYALNAPLANSFEEEIEYCFVHVGQCP